MLKRIELTCFRKHVSSVFEFDEGLHVLRGANEAGKSTLIEGVLYAMFGSRALRTPLADTVTWGRDEKELKVVLWLGDYVFTRSSRGAEVTKAGKVYVTGQNEVTQFAASIVGADANMASKLMLASQNNLRGSLEAGPKATAEMIEALADFDLFDKIIDAMQSKLALGNTAPMEAMLASSEAELAAYPDLVQPDRAKCDADIEKHQGRVNELNTAIADAEKVVAEAAEKLLNAQMAMNTRAKLLEDKSRTLQDISRLGQEIEVNEQLVSSAPQASDVEVLESKLTSANAYARKLAAHTFVSGLKYDNVWDEPLASLEAEIASWAKNVGMLNQQIRDKQLDKSRLALEIVEHITDTCPQCKQKLPESSVHAIEKRNEEVLAEIELIEHSIEALEYDLLQGQNMLDALQTVRSVGAQVTLQASKHGDHVVISDTQVPPLVTMVGDFTPSEVPDVEILKKSLVKMKEQVQQASVAKGRVASATNSFSKAQETLAEIDRKIESITVTKVEVDELGTAKALKEARLSALNLERSGEVMAVEFAKKAYSEALDLYETLKVKRQSLESKVEEQRNLIATINFNNALLRKVRAARPIIADKLWTMVLGAVSTMFSVMRGEPSTVSKSKDGFTVNGQAVASLSGSTLDILGLAIRIALLKTFLPSSPFIILDEPASGCDDNRTAAMIGFVSSCGFNQTILITHEDVSESAASKLIEV